MKKFLLGVAVFVTLTITARAQSSEFGFTLGATEFFGELGGANNIGRPFFWDTEFSQTRWAAGFIYRLNLSGFSSVRFNLFYARIDGDDQATSYDNSFSFYRRFRNLNFKSDIYEFSFQYEQNLMRYQIGRRRYRFAPYLLVGFGGFYFNPKTKSGIPLQPLNTEGQGSALYPDRQPYSLIQPNVLTGLGFKFNLSDQWSLGFEYGHRFTFTDYIDDVSKTYVEDEAFLQMHDAQTAVEAINVSRGPRDPEYDDPSWDYVTEPGRQRGDPADYDHYIFTGMITLTYTVAKGRIYCPKF